MPGAITGSRMACRASYRSPTVAYARIGRNPPSWILRLKRARRTARQLWTWSGTGLSHLTGLTAQRSLLDFSPASEVKMTEISLPRRHELKPLLNISEEGRKALQTAYEFQPRSYEGMVALKGMGPKKIRALALISDLTYGAKPSWKDPAKYSFAHGG